MIKTMSSKHSNGNGHVGIEFFSRWFIGFYFYPESGEYSVSVCRRGGLSVDIWRFVRGKADAYRKAALPAHPGEGGL